MEFSGAGAKNSMISRLQQDRTAPGGSGSETLPDTLKE